MPSFSTKIRTIYLGSLVAALFIGSPAAWPADAPTDMSDAVESAVSNTLTELSIEDLMNLDVTSVSKKSEPMTQAPAAIYVLTNEEIRRSGASSIPEALRLVPGVEVARLNANRWAITVRGFNGVYAQKLLVLVDGRSVYSPLFAGVHWQLQDIMLEDVERIEIIRGPGAALWGANAVNGVINIITKHARDTQGGLLNVGGGSTRHFDQAFRYGGQVKENLHFRVYEKYFEHAGYETPEGRSGKDRWQMLRTGFRMDWDVAPEDQIVVQGDAYTGEAGQYLTNPRPFPPLLNESRADFYDLYGGNLLGRWTHVFSDSSEIMLQTYYDHTYRDERVIRENRHTFDFELQHRFQLGERNEITWGMGYRFTDDNLQSSYTLVQDPASRSDNLFSLFFQDRITLIEDHLLLTAGARLEHNDYTGLEIQPSLRLQWMPNETHSFWAAISRAVQTPSRAYTDQRFNIVRLPLSTVSIFGNRSVSSEEVISYEAGYRVQVAPKLFLDAALFYSRYDHLRSREPGLPFIELFPLPPHFVIPYYLDNKMEGTVHGVELSADWRVCERWRLAAGYAYHEIDLDLNRSSYDSNSTKVAGRSPQQQFNIRSYLNITPRLEFDALLFFVDQLPGFDVKGYERLDLYFRYRPNDSLELALGLQNALDSRHLEFISREGIAATEAKREIFGEVTWRF